MSRIFKENGFSSESVLCAQDYVRFVDAEKKEFVPEKISPIIKLAEVYLEKTYFQDNHNLPNNFF